MTSHQLKTQLRFGMALLAGGLALSAASPSVAQAGYGMPIYQEDPGAALSRNLRTLAESPRNFGALTGAAKAALELGDAQAAATFYARAEEIAPRDGRVKAGLGSSFLAMEQAQAALKFFEDARALGTPEGEFASDRGLANDLLGNPAQAQRDYALAMRTNDNDELRRRMALSKAITGDRAGALAAIEPQLRRQDRAGWRVRAFVLALTGDANGATETVRTLMPTQAAAMQPFLSRLPSLRPADRAAAVHFGHFPGDGQGFQVAQAPQQYAGLSPSLSQSIATPTYSLNRNSTPLQATPTPRATPTPAPVAAPVRNRPQSRQSELSFGEERDLLRGAGTSRRRGVSQPVQQQPTQIARADTRVASPGQAPGRVATIANSRPALSQVNDPLARASVARPVQSFAPVQRPIVNTAPAATQAGTAPPQNSGVGAPLAAPTQFADAAAVRTSAAAVQGPPAGASLPSAIAPVTQSGPANLLPNIATTSPSIQVAAGPTPNASAAPSGSLSNVLASTVTSSAQAPTTAPVTSVTPPVPSAIVEATPPKAPAATGISSGLADIAATIRALPSEETKPAIKLAEAAPKAAPKLEPAKKVAAVDGAPSRQWVQIASAPEKLTVSEYKRLKAKAPKLLGDTTAWKAAFRSSNRVLVGPFADEKEAQTLVNALAKANIVAVPWTSAQGQEIVKLATQ